MDKQQEKKLSYKVFMEFTDLDGDASNMLSKDCYDKWVTTRKSPPQHPAESFRRVLTAHVCGLDGRKPFPKKVEENLLPLLREKKIWPCFNGTDVTIGIRGFRKQGFHEKNSSSVSNLEIESPKRKSRKRRSSGFSEPANVSDDDDDSVLTHLSDGTENMKKLRTESEDLFLRPVENQSLHLQQMDFSSLMTQFNTNNLHLQLLMLQQMNLLENMNSPETVFPQPQKIETPWNHRMRYLIPLAEQCLQ